MNFSKARLHALHHSVGDDAISIVNFNLLNAGAFCGYSKRKQKKEIKELKKDVAKLYGIVHYATKCGHALYLEKGDRQGDEKCWLCKRAIARQKINLLLDYAKKTVKDIPAVLLLQEEAMHLRDHDPIAAQDERLKELIRLGSRAIMSHKRKQGTLRA
jgi:hypothetical protein